MIETFYNVWDSFYNGMFEVYEWFMSDYSLLGFSGQIYELIIGAGVTVVIAYIIFNWIV